MPAPVDGPWRQLQPGKPPVAAGERDLQSFDEFAKQGSHAKPFQPLPGWSTGQRCHSPANMFPGIAADAGVALNTDRAKSPFSKRFICVPRS
jgi:hypothetical protein